MTFYFRKLEPETLLFFPGLINIGDLYSNITMLDIFHIGCRPVIKISKFSSVYLIFCFCKMQYTCQQQGRVEMYAGLFKQNCDRSWITAATPVARVDTRRE